MITLNHLYCGKISFETFLKENDFDRNCECLIRIYTAVCLPEEAVVIAKEIKSLLPASHILGSSGSGVIFNGVQYHQDTLIVIEQMEKTNVKIHTFSFYQKTSKDVASMVAAPLYSEDGAVLMHIVCGDHYPDIHDFVNEFNQKKIPVKLVGGVAGDVLPKNIDGYVFTENGAIFQGIVTATYYNKDLHLFHRVNISHEPISPVYQLSLCNGSIIEEIEGCKAEDWCKEQLGMKTLSFYEDWQTIAENDALLRFPIVLEGHSGASRFIKFDSQAQKMSIYFSQLPTGTLFRIGYVSPIKCVTESYSVCNEMEQYSIESLFCYTCLFRKLYLQNCAEWELKPFSAYEVCGVFMMGEIASLNGVNEFLNGSCCFSGIAENEKYVQPDYGVFADLYQIKDENESLLHFVLKKQSEEMSRENKTLLEKLLLQQTLAQNQLYIDITTGLPNSIRYLEDNKTLCFNKLCTITIENAELLMSRLGNERYSLIFKSVCEEIYFYCRQLKDAEDIHFYIQSETMMFVAANDRILEDNFVDIVNVLYRQFQFRKLLSNTELMISRFVLVLNQNDLLEKAFNTIKNCTNVQTDFLVWDSSIETGSLQEDEMQMICILNQAIEENLVIPFFQGIYDNQTKQINKFESLMRIQDNNGTIYCPADFMDIAKKYHLYSKISMKMVEQVLTLFAGRKEIVSINLSAYDINYSTSSNKIFDMLEEIGDARNFVFEILEDEKFRDLTLLQQFIEKARTYGVRIAIDDFGCGYSNFMEIAKIEPDFIKIDGSIIKNVVDNILYQKVSRNIVFLGSQLNAELVAEFVENGQIQKKVAEMGIQFSQGYFFAKPIPFEKLNLS